jgi:hypothetical protein
MHMTGNNNSIVRKKGIAGRTRPAAAGGRTANGAARLRAGEPRTEQPGGDRVRGTYFACLRAARRTCAMMLASVNDIVKHMPTLGNAFGGAGNDRISDPIDVTETHSREALDSGGTLLGACS